MRLLYWVFAIQLVLFGLIITGVLPRETSLFLAVGLLVYVLWASLEDAVIFFIISIPLFLALPLTENFDNFNTWRLLAVIIFLKWMWPQIFNFQSIFNQFSISKFFKEFNLHTILLLALLLLAVGSIIPAIDKIVALKRIIYFVNLSLIGIVIYDLGNRLNFIKRLIKNIPIPIIVVALVGYIQLISTYFVDIYEFMRIWGEGIQCRQFGNQWCDIAVWLGNTWFAYYGEQLSLRVFSLFPDSHSFPQFILLGIPAVFATMWQKTMNFRKQILLIFVLALLFLIAILSGTRGIWLAGAGIAFLSLGLIFWNNRVRIEVQRQKIFKNISLYLILFFILFAAAFPIFSSPQFLLGKSDSDLIRQRIKSIIDFGETSNEQRIVIWKESIKSIKQKPFLGVGIGNFPIILGQDVWLGRAGSSAHNLYLHVAAEMGILALLIFLWFLWVLFRKSYYNFAGAGDSLFVTYFGASLLFIPWVLAYSLTDVAIFDERAFLFFIANCAIILGFNRSPRPYGHGILPENIKKPGKCRAN